MIIKTKKKTSSGIVKQILGGEIKEILIHSDIFSPQREKISVCFRGNKSSGIIELSSEEVERLYKTIHSKMKLVKDIKVL